MPAIRNERPDLLAEAGFVYQTDWKFDDHPVPIKVRSGRLVCIPYTGELNDVPMLGAHFEADYFAEWCIAQFDQLYREGERNGRLMCIAIHPFVIGRPHRIGYLDRVLDYILSHDGVWQATTDEIAAYYLENYYDAAVAHAARAEGPVRAMSVDDSYVVPTLTQASTTAITPTCPLTPLGLV